MALAKPAWAYARFPLTVGHQVMDTTKLRRLPVHLVPAATALRDTARWYQADPARGAATAQHLPDAFDYAAEDRIIAALEDAAQAIETGGATAAAYAHPLAHPRS